MRGFPIVDGRTGDLLVSGELELLRGPAPLDLLPHDLVGSVLARRLDADGVFAGLDRLARVILAVPLQAVLARRTSGARAGSGYVVAFGQGAHSVVAIPGAQVGEPARFLVPDRDRAH